MGNPKFIPTQKKVTYSFRIEEDRLEKVKQISKLNDIKLPQLMSDIIKDYLFNKTVYNTYLEDLEGMFIDLPDITQGSSYDEFQGSYWKSSLTFEYEIQKIPNNLDVWDSLLETYKATSEHTLHEGVEFLIVPDLCHYDREHYTNLLQYLYCIYFRVLENNTVQIEYLSFMDSVNKIKKCENYPLLDYALKIKETLEERTNEIENQISMRLQKGEEVIDFNYVWSELERLSKTFNTGNIIPMNESRREIKYKAKVQQLSDSEIVELYKENEEMRKQLKEMDSIVAKLDKLEENQKEMSEFVLGDISEERLEEIRKHL